MNDDEVTARLKELGELPVESSTASSHLTAMASVEPKQSRRFGRVAVASAALAGFLLGGSGLAVAGAMPKPVEDAVNKVLETTGFRNRGECVSQAARAGDKAAKDACPKGGNGQGRGKANLEERKNDGDPCKGPPIWAGRGRPTAEEKAAHLSARAACPDDSSADATADAAEDDAESTTTTTTTTAPTTTTTT